MYCAVLILIWNEPVFIYIKVKSLYRAFCAGSIITKERVLTSSHCFLTNRKRKKKNFKEVKIVGGILDTLAEEQNDDSIQQWRNIKHLYSQRLYRFPAYNLAIVKVDKPWSFNKYVDKMPYTQWNQDFDGVCIGTTVRITKSWSTNKHLYKIYLKMNTKKLCERKMLRSCHLYYCTDYDVKRLTAIETEGAALICHGTGDPAEDAQLGVIVGVTSLMNFHLPTLHNRVGLFHKWVTDTAAPRENVIQKIIMVFCIHLLGIFL